MIKAISSPIFIQVDIILMDSPYTGSASVHTASIIHNIYHNYLRVILEGKAKIFFFFELEM